MKTKIKRTSKFLHKYRGSVVVITFITLSLWTCDSAEGCGIYSLLTIVGVN